MIWLGQSGLNVESCYGLTAQDVVERHRKLKSLGLKTFTTHVREHIVFTLLTDLLIESQFDPKLMIAEYNKAQMGELTELRHAVSLCQLTYHYHITGHDVELLRSGKAKSPDLKVDGVGCELKTRADQTWLRLAKRGYWTLVGEGRHDELAELLSSATRSMTQDLDAAWRSRGSEAQRQGEYIVLDLSNHFHTWNYHRLREMEMCGCIRGLHSVPVAPIPGAVGLFSPDNAMNSNSSSFTQRAYFGHLFVEHGIEVLNCSATRLLTE